LTVPELTGGAKVVAVVPVYVKVRAGNEVASA
jgi:hypothetical protein